MPAEEAYAFYDAFVRAAGPEGRETQITPEQPDATFYVDHSGVRENYWHIDGAHLSFDLTAQTGHMLNAAAKGALGYKLGLVDIAYDEMGNTNYLSAAKSLFEALFGAGSVADVQVNAVYDGSFCTVDPVMADGSGYAIEYAYGLIRQITFFPARERWMWEHPNWEADYEYINLETGETFTEGW